MLGIYSSLLYPFNTQSICTVLSSAHTRLLIRINSTHAPCPKYLFYRSTHMFDNSLLSSVLVTRKELS